MLLKEMCSATVQACNAGMGFVRLPETPRIADVARQLEAMPATTGKQSDLDYNRIASELKEILLARGDLESRQLRRAAWCLWQTEPALASEPDVISPLLDAYSSSESDRPFRALATSWLSDFRPSLPHLSGVAATLRQLAARWPTRLSEAHKMFSIFDESEGPKRLAGEVISSRQPVTNVFQKIGLGALAANGGYAESVTEKVFARLSKGEVGDPLLRMQIIEEVATVGGKLLFPSLNPQCIAALLRPAVQSGEIRQDAKDRLLRFILPRFGDPRLRAGNWISVEPDLRNLVVRWLSRQSLHQFFDIVDDTAHEYMWPYRRAFWEAVYSFYEGAGVEVEAWVAFGDQGAYRARQIFGPAASFGRLRQDGKQVESGHAVLLLKIGNVFVADWSHNGKCNVWLDQSDDGCPALYKLEYGSDEVRLHVRAGNYDADGRISWAHGGSESYTWQKKIAEVLARRLRRTVPSARYMVKQ